MKRRWMEVFVTNGLEGPQKKNTKTKREEKHYNGLSSDSLAGTQFKVAKRQKTTFKPLYTHQIFTKDEQIRGVEDLQISISLTPLNLRAFAEISWNRAKNFEGVDPMLKEHFKSGNITFSKKTFNSWVKEESVATPPGDLVFSTARQESKQKQKREFEVYRVQTQGNEKYHQTLQAMFYFFIESCSFIEPDSQWSYFILFEKHSNGEYSTLAYTTLFEDFDRVRKSDFEARISQFLVLPCYQRQGFAKLLLDGVYQYYDNNVSCTELSVEKPTKEFAAVRDRYEQQLILKKKYFKCMKSVFSPKPKACITKKNFGTMKLSMLEIETIKRDLKINRSRTLRHFQNLLIDNIKPAHPDHVRELKELIRSQVSRIRQKLVNKQCSKQVKKTGKKVEEENVIQCIQFDSDSSEVEDNGQELSSADSLDRGYTPSGGDLSSTSGGE